MADMTAAQWAALVLQDLGAPQSANNINNMLAWMKSENQWPPPRNNPLNNGLGSGGGSGLGSYPDLATAAQYAAKGLQGGITGAAGIGQALVSDAPFSTFHQATISATWSGDHYAGTEWLGATSPTTMGVSGAAASPDLASLAALSPADKAAFQSAIANPATAAYFKSLAAGPASTAATAAAGPAVTPSSSTSISGVSYVGTQQQTSALSTIESNLQTFGFSPAQVTQLTNWAWGEITNNVDPSQIAIDLQSQPAFLSQFPGFAPANAELTKQGLPAVSVQQYQQYQTQAMAMAQAAGLPTGFINSNNVGTLVGGNVSTAELSSRLNNAVTLAYQSTPEDQAVFNQYFGAQYANQPLNATDWQALAQAGAAGGTAYLQALHAQAAAGQGGLSIGQIASIALDPSVAEPLIAQQIQTAQIGGASVTSGVGALQQSTATQLAQAGITTSQATNAFQQLAPLSALETARPGMGGEAAQGVVSADQLATGNLIGNPAAQRQQQTAVEVAKAPFAGGGGFVSTNKGVGAGSANPNGAPGQ